MERINIIENNMGLVVQAIKKVTRGTVTPGTPDYEDLMAEGAKKLWELAEKYDPEKGEFSTLAVISLNRMINRYYYKYLYSSFSIKENIGNFADRNISVVRIDAIEDPYDAENLLSTGSFENSSISDVFVENLLNKYRAQCTGKAAQVENTILNLVIQGYTMGEIAEQLGTSRQYVDQTYGKICVKLVKLLLGNNKTISKEEARALYKKKLRGDYFGL